MSEPRKTSCPSGGGHHAKRGRRDFLRKGALAAGAISLFPAPWVMAGQRVRGANDRVGVGFIGTGGRAQARKSRRVSANDVLISGFRFQVPGLFGRIT